MDNSTIDVATEAVAQIETALAVLKSGSAAHTALTAQLETARGELALAQAEAGRQAERAQAEAEAEAALAGITDETRRAAMLAAVKAAIAAEYDPTPQAVAQAAQADRQATRRPASPNTLARNAAVAADPNALARGRSYLEPFDATDAARVVGVKRDSGTRYPSLVALASTGPGVDSRGDYMLAVSAVRLYMESIGYRGAGIGAADNPWLLAQGRHAADGDKGRDSFPLKWQTYTRLALYPDGKFRMARNGTAGVRFVDSDAAAWQQWSGSHSAAAPVPAAEAAPSTRPAPTPPNVAVNPYGQLTRVVVCKHCSHRTLAGQPTCGHCKGIAYES